MKKKTEKSEPDDIKIEPFRQNLPVILTKEEVAERAQRSAHLIADHDFKEAQFKDEAASNKRVLARINVQIRELSNEVRDGKTYQDVACERVFNWTNGTVHDRRTDTGEVISERAMSEAEKQKALPFERPAGDIDDEFGDPKKPDAENEDDDGETAAE